MALHLRWMIMTEPSSQQLRAKALSLVMIAAVTAGLVVEEWQRPSDPLLFWPLIAAYFIFNFGFCWFALRMRPFTKGTRAGALAVLMNFLAMSLSSFEVIWTAVSVGAALMAVGAAYMLFGEAKTARA